MELAKIEFMTIHSTTKLIGQLPTTEKFTKPQDGFQLFIIYQLNHTVDGKKLPQFVKSFNHQQDFVTESITMFLEKNIKWGTLSNITEQNGKTVVNAAQHQDLM